MNKGKMFVDWWIQCGRCEYMEALAASEKKAANEARDARGWVMKRKYGYICPECRQELSGASFITSNVVRLEEMAEREVAI